MKEFQWENIYGGNTLTLEDPAEQWGGFDRFREPIYFRSEAGS